MRTYVAPGNWLGARELATVDITVHFSPAVRHPQWENVARLFAMACRRWPCLLQGIRPGCFGPISAGALGLGLGIADLTVAAS